MLFHRLPGLIFCAAVALVLVAALTSCHVFPKAQASLRDALSQGIIQARIDSLLKASADSVLNVVLKTERFQQLGREWGVLLHQGSDSLYTATDTILNGLVRDFTAQWLQQADSGLQTMLTHAKTNLTDGQLKQYITDLVAKDLAAALDQLLDRLTARLRSPELKTSIADLRLFLDLQLDTLSRSATRGFVAVMNDSLLPKLNQLLDKVVQERDKTQKGVTSTIWIILIGIVAIILIAFLIRALYLKLRYQKMLKLITSEVDKIDSQPVYDRLVHNVSEKMKAEGLEKTLRKDILEEQGLTDQPEWQDKNEKLLRILVEEVKNTPLSTEQLREKLKQNGLEEHFESVQRSMNPPG